MRREERGEGLCNENSEQRIRDLHHFHVGTVNSWPEHIHEGDSIEWDSRGCTYAFAAQFKIWVPVVSYIGGQDLISDCVLFSTLS